jgi:hypothetical protein
VRRGVDDLLACRSPHAAAPPGVVRGEPDFNPIRDSPSTGATYTVVDVVDTKEAT